MAERNHRDTARKLRAKAADNATPPSEREALIAKAEEIESRIPRPVTLTREKFINDYFKAEADSWLARHATDIDDIIEHGYHYNREGDDY